MGQLDNLAAFKRTVMNGSIVIMQGDWHNYILYNKFKIGQGLKFVI